MSIKSTLTSGVSSSLSKHTNPDSVGLTRITDDWVRNPSWTPLPTVLDTEQKVVLLFAVTSLNNAIGITVSGAYAVDWGDGTSTTHTAASIASKTYDYTAASLANTNAPVTLSTGTNLVNRTAHGYTDGMVVTLYDVVTTTSIISGINYYVVNATTDDFQLSLTKGGNVETINASGTAALLDHKQAIITITPQSGQNLTSVSFNSMPAGVTIASNTYVNGMLDLLISGPNLTTLTLSANVPATWLSRLERAQLISTNSVINQSYMFSKCTALRSVPTWTLPSTGSVNLANMFEYCRELKTAPMMNTVAVTATTNMFTACSALAAVPLYNLAACTSTTSMFSLCSNLQSVPPFNLSAATNTSGMFSTCTSLKNVPAFNLSSSTNNSSMFYACSSLETVPMHTLRAVSGGLTVNLMFSNCTNLKTVAPLNLSFATNTASMFSGCFRLSRLPWTSITMPLCTNASSMFYSCTFLEEVPTVNLTNTAAVTVSGMFNLCTSLQRTGTITIAQNTGSINIDNMFTGCNSLTEVYINNTTVAVGSASGAFQTCKRLRKVRFGSAGVNLSTATTAVFSDCPNLLEHPSFSAAAAAAANAVVGLYSNSSMLKSGGLTGLKYTHALVSLDLNATDFTNQYIKNIGISAQVPSQLTMTNCTGSGLKTTASTTLQNNNKTVTCASTSALSVGMSIGSYINIGGCQTVSVTSTIATSLFTLAGHGFPNGHMVAFTNVNTTTGVAIQTLYYVVNATTDTFQLAATVGGAALTLGGTGSSLTLVFSNYIESITNATTFTMVIPWKGTTTSSTNLVLHKCDVNYALLKGWQIAG